MDIRNKIIEIIQDLNDDFNPNECVDLIEEGILDSFGIINFIMEVDEAFNVRIGVEDILPENFENIESIQKLIEGLINC